MSQAVAGSSSVDDSEQGVQQPIRQVTWMSGGTGVLVFPR